MPKRFYQVWLTCSRSWEGKMIRETSTVDFRSRDDQTAIERAKAIARSERRATGQQHFVTCIQELSSGDCCTARIIRTVLGKEPK